MVGAPTPARTPPVRHGHHGHETLHAARALANQAFSRAANAPLIGGNHVRLLRDAAENYPAWLEAIESARRHVHFENYMFFDDDVGAMFADAFVRKAREGVRVRVVYDWFGSVRNASSRYWDRLRDAGVEVRSYNPPRLDSPFGWLSRDHRKFIAIDGEIGFVTGLCIGEPWVGNAEKGIPPWRDTGVEIRGPVVDEIEEAFSEMWASLGEPIPAEDPGPRGAPALSSAATQPGDMHVRIVATVPATAGMFRLDLLIAALARKRLWLTDAYYAGTTPYVQALRAAAMDGVDVRLLVPNATDVPPLRPITRAGYRPLLQAGIRVFEWNGSMLHAKTAVADGRWARVGSTNLNIASWLGNVEMDAVVEDESFAHELEEMYLQDLEQSTEVVLDLRHRPRVLGRPSRAERRRRPRRHRGSAARVAAGAVRIGNTVGAAFTDRRALEPIEARITGWTAAALIALAVVFALEPRILVYPVVFLLIWTSISLILRAHRLSKERSRGAEEHHAREEDTGESSAPAPAIDQAPEVASPGTSAPPPPATS